ncbi:MAG TPA: hypothetical protein VFZ77_21840 [Acidimicrobiales bacterium]
MNPRAIAGVVIGAGLIAGCGSQGTDGGSPDGAADLPAAVECGTQHRRPAADCRHQARDRLPPVPPGGSALRVRRGADEAEADDQQRHADEGEDADHGHADAGGDEGDPAEEHESAHHDHG